MNFDVELLGDCDVIVNELCHRLGGDFEQLCCNSSRLSEITETSPQPNTLPEHACAKVQTSEVQNTGHFFTEQEETVAETSETVTVIDACPNAHFPNDGGLSTSCIAKEARPSPELENRSLPKPSTHDGCLDAQPNPCQESSDTNQNAPLDSIGHHPTKREGIMSMKTEEKHTNQNRKPCWLKQVCQNPISNRLGGKIKFFFFGTISS